MLPFVNSFGCKSVDRSTYCMKRGRVSFLKCAHGQRFYNPMKLLKEASHTYNYVFLTMIMKTRLISSFLILHLKSSFDTCGFDCRSTSQHEF